MPLSIHYQHSCVLIIKPQPLASGSIEPLLGSEAEGENEGKKLKQPPRSKAIEYYKVNMSTCRLRHLLYLRFYLRRASAITVSVYVSS
jgi:hypothetical protein